MAYLDTAQTEDQKDQTAGSQNTLNAAPSTAGGVASGGGPGGVSASGASYNAAAPTSGSANTGFQNLQSYLDANSGNNMAGQIAGKISDQATQASSGLQDAQQSFKGAVDQNTVGDDSANTQSVLSNPTGADPSATQKFQQQLNANYGGPTDSSQYGAFTTAQSKGQDVYQRAQAAQTEGGRQSLLKNYFGTPNYTRGEQSLDSALVGNDKSGALEGVQTSVQNLPAQFQQAGRDLNQYAQAGAGKTAAARSAARSALGVDDAGNYVQTGTDSSGHPTYGGAIGSTYGQLSQQDAQALKAAQDALTKEQQTLSAPAATELQKQWGQGASHLFGGDAATAESTLEALGLAPDVAKGLTNADVSYLTGYGAAPDAKAFYTAGVPTTASVADPALASKLAALEGLAHPNGTPSLASPYLAQAGAPSGKSVFDSAGYTKALGDYATNAWNQEQAAIPGLIGQYGNGPGDSLAGRAEAAQSEANTLRSFLGLPLLGRA